MSFIFMIMAVPFLSATGIYNPQVMHHGHCIAEPGSFDALYCSASAEAAPHYRKYRAPWCRFLQHRLVFLKGLSA